MRYRRTNVLTANRSVSYPSVPSGDIGKPFTVCRGQGGGENRLRKVRNLHLQTPENVSNGHQIPPEMVTKYLFTVSICHVNMKAGMCRKACI